MRFAPAAHGCSVTTSAMSAARPHDPAATLGAAKTNEGQLGWRTVIDFRRQKLGGRSEHDCRSRSRWQLPYFEIHGYVKNGLSHT